MRIAVSGTQASKYRPSRLMGERRGCMAKGSVLDFDASQQDQPSDDQGFFIGVGLVGSPFAAGLVAVSAEHRKAAGMHVPGFGNAEFHAAEEAIDLDNRLNAVNIGVAKVELQTAKHGGGFAAAKTPTGD